MFPFEDMPAFRDEQGRVMIWDPTSKSYVVSTQDGLPHPDRGHATGGDNDLFDPFRHTEREGVPELEGHMARISAEWAPKGQVKCPNCESATDQHACPTCGKDLTPEWNQERGSEFLDAQPQHSNASEFTSWPEREPKRNWLKTDNSFPSMTSAYDLAVRLATTHVATDEWDDLFSGTTPTKVEIGKWLIDRGGNLHIDHGVHALHDQIAARDGINYPGDVGALGSVYNDGTADTQRVFPHFQFDLQTAQAQITQAFGPVTLQPPVGQVGHEQKGHTFEPFEIQGGQWVIAPHFASQPITGIAWVKERPEGTSYQPNMILIAEHLQPEDFQLWSRGVTAIVTATGGLTSHAAYLASTKGIPVVVGIGEAYNKIETGNHLKVDPTTQTITVMPGASGSMSPENKRDIWNTYLQYQRQRGGSLTAKPEYFSHIDEELAWREANTPTLDSCPECHQPMMDQDGESVCHGCGHRQPIIQQTAAVLAPLGEAAIGGLAAGGVGGIGGIAGIGGLMTRALGSPGASAGINGARLLGLGGGHEDAANTTPYDAGAEMQGVISKIGEEEVGIATKNRGDNSNPETQTSSGASSKEHGDAPEQLKDVEGPGGASEGDDPEKRQGDPALQDKAMKAFHMNLPLVIEFSHSDEVGFDNPILRALDELLEEAFPGYKDGHDEAAAEDEHPVEEINAEINPEEASEDDEGESGADKPDAKEASVWHFAGEFEEALAELPPVTSEEDPDAETPLADFRWYESFPHTALSYDTGQPAPMGAGGLSANGGDPNAVQQYPGGTCPMCGQSHLPGTPCPTPAADPNAVTAPAASGGQVTPPQPQTVVTKWQVVAVGEAPAADLTPGDVIAAYRDGTIVLDDGITTYDPIRAKKFGDQYGYQDDRTQIAQPTPGLDDVGVLAPGDGNDVGVRGPMFAAADPEFAFFAAAGEGEHHRKHEVDHKPEHEHEHHEESQDDPDAFSEDTSTPWLDEAGAPLQEGADYELKSSDYAIPDRVTIDRVLPDKLVFTIHSGDVDYRDEISTEDVETNNYSFAPVGTDDSQVDSIDGFEPEAPIRPGQDALPQQDDLSTPSTVVSHEKEQPRADEFAPISLDTYTGSFHGDTPDARSWLMEDSSPVAVDPALMAKFAGKNFSPREQREFIDESGEARNLDRLDLSGTHYITDDLDAAFNW